MRIDLICNQRNINNIVWLFNISFLIVANGDDNKKNYYCGITHDLGERQANHRNPDYVTTIKCDSFETSAKLERMLHAEGFDTGKQLGHGTEKSIFVYMYKKIPGVTNESIEA